MEDAFERQKALATEVYVYSMNSDFGNIEVHTDPAGLWHAGVAATVWDASLILAKYFERSLARAHDNPAGKTSNDMSLLLNNKTSRVLELGAGCSALPTLVLAQYARKHDEIVSSVESNLVTAKAKNEAASRVFGVTDKSNALPLLRKTIETQSSQLSEMIDVRELDWQAHGKLPREGKDHRWDLIIASDLLAFPELYGSLVSTLIALSDSSTVVYMAYERRTFSAEIEFFRLLGEAFTFEMIPEKELDEVWRAPGEIYLYRAKRR